MIFRIGSDLTGTWIEVATIAPLYLYASSSNIKNDAWIAEVFVLQEMGRKDIISEKFSAAYDSRTGQFDSDKLWELLKRVYPDYPDY